jgi:hypothetical protein
VGEVGGYFKITNVRDFYETARHEKDVVHLKKEGTAEIFLPGTLTGDIVCWIETRAGRPGPGKKRLTSKKPIC